MVGLFVFVIFTQYTPLYDASLLLGNPCKINGKFSNGFYRHFRQVQHALCIIFCYFWIFSCQVLKSRDPACLMGRSSISEDKTDELELRQQNIQGYKDNKESKPRAGIVEDQWHNGRIPAVCSST